jgi:hypothetical protein
MSVYHLMMQHGLIEQMAKEKLAKIWAADRDRQALITQLVAIGVCPCVAQGRASTCCGVPT